MPFLHRMAYQNVSILKTEIDSYLIDELSNATALQYSEINADFYNITNRGNQYI